jgi:hypothetical protein
MTTGMLELAKPATDVGYCSNPGNVGNSISRSDQGWKKELVLYHDMS